MKFRICENCGMHLDFGEVCDCQKEKADTSANVPTQRLEFATDSLPQNPDYVKAALNLAATLRATKAKYKDIAETVKQTFPRFNRQLLTACANWEDYGVILHPDGVAAIYAAYDVPKMKRKDNRKLDRRITFRCTTANYERIERNMARTGANTMQEFIAAAVAAYNEAVEHD